MKEEDLKPYLSSIEEYVFDEKRIITSTWLAITLGIHVDLAKHLLKTFYENNTKKDELSATYLLIGKSTNTNNVHITVVQEKDIEDAETKFQAITSKHVYSVQKSAELTDLNTLYLAGKTDDVELISKGISAIEFNYVERNCDLMEKLRLNGMPANESKPVALSKKTFSSNQENKNKVSNVEPKVQQPPGHNVASEEQKEPEVKSFDKKIPPMFGKTAATTNKKPTNKANAAKKLQGIGAFFSKAPPPPPKQNKETKLSGSCNDVKEVLDTKETSPSKENKPNLNNKNEDEKTSKTDECHVQPSPKTTSVAQGSKPKQKQKKAESKSTKSTKSKKAPANKKENEGKQRKRLVVLSDSDSGQSSDEEAKEKVLRREPSPEPEPVVVVPDEDDDMVCATPEPASRKRKKKLVSKTFTGPDGYMVTQKELVDVSCSEDETEVVNPQKKLKSDTEVTNKKVEEPSSRNENANSSKTSKAPINNRSKSKDKKEQAKSNSQSPQKTKQASLMSFFKKK